jgi:acetyl esterase/lipase
MALDDGQPAVGLVRLHAAEWHIDPRKIGVLGFSAGGHLSAATSTQGGRSWLLVCSRLDYSRTRPHGAPRTENTPPLSNASNPMRISSSVVVLALAAVPAVGTAQSSAPAADAFRHNAARAEKNLVAAADEMPADKYGYKPTAAQMSFAEIVLHVAQDNDEACPPIGGAKAPDRAKLTPADDKTKLVARLRESFAFCEQSVAHLDDSNLAGSVSAFGQQWTRVAMMMERVDDWSDHYSQFAIYLRLNNLLPPTAKPRS